MYCLYWCCTRFGEASVWKVVMWSYSLGPRISQLFLSRPFHDQCCKFCLQHSTYAVIMKASGGPGDFRCIFSFFLPECWLHFSANTETLETGHLIKVFLCFSLAWSKYAAGTQETSSCCILRMHPFQFKFLKLISQQQRPTFCHSSDSVHLSITKTFDKPLVLIFWKLRLTWFTYKDPVHTAQ